MSEESPKKKIKTVLEDENIRDLLDKDVIIKKDNGVYMCIVCNCNISGSMQAEAHAVGNKHKKKVNLLKNESEQSSVRNNDENKSNVKEIMRDVGLTQKENSEYYCEFCNVQMNGPKTWEQHVLGKSHKKAVNNKNMVGSSSDATRRNNAHHNEASPASVSRYEHLASSPKSPQDHVPMDRNKNTNGDINLRSSPVSQRSEPSSTSSVTECKCKYLVVDKDKPIPKLF